MMNILETKGHLKKQPGEKAQTYAPVRRQQQVVRSMVREFVDRVFDGSARPLLVHLLKEKGFTGRERRELQKLLQFPALSPRKALFLEQVHQQRAGRSIEDAIHELAHHRSDDLLLATDGCVGLRLFAGLLLEMALRLEDVHHRLHGGVTDGASALQVVVDFANSGM